MLNIIFNPMHYTGIYMHDIYWHICIRRGFLIQCTILVYMCVYTYMIYTGIHVYRARV